MTLFSTSLESTILFLKLLKVLKKKLLKTNTSYKETFIQMWTSTLGLFTRPGIPTNMFTAMFVLGRLPGWLAQWKEMREDPESRIARPRQVYVGSETRNYSNRSTLVLNLLRHSPFLFVEKILNYEHIYQNLLTPLSETKLISELKEISKNFTINRDKIGEYVVSKEMVSAYTSFYLPTNIPKFYFLMNQLPEKIRQRIGELDFLDVGTVPGTYLVAHDHYFKNGKRLYGLDSSSLMLEQAKKLLGDRVVLSSALPTTLVVAFSSLETPQ